MSRSPSTIDDPIQHRLAAVVPADRFEAAWAAYEAASMAGLCHEGAWEVALGVATAEKTGDARSHPSSSHP